MKQWSTINETKNTLNQWDVILGLAIIDSNLLEFTNYPQNKYLFKDHSFKTLLDHTMSQHSNMIKWNTTNIINDINIFVERDWAKLVKTYKKSKELTKQFTPITNIAFNSDGLDINSNSVSRSNKTTYGNKLVLDTLFGIDKSIIYQNTTLWDNLIKNWMKLVFLHATPDTTTLIENFMFDNAVVDLTFEEYKKISTEEYKYIGIYVPSLDKNYKKLKDLLKALIKYDKNWNNYQYFISQWNHVKNTILNKQILLPIIKDKIEHKHLKQGILHLIADNLDMRDYEYTSINNLKNIPSRNTILDKHVILSVSFWNNEKFDFVYLIKCTNEQNQEIAIIEIEIGWSSGIPETSLNTKVKIKKLNVDTLIN